jgi:hypothetical protein
MFFCIIKSMKSESNKSAIYKVKGLLHLDDFYVTQKGRLPMTKISRFIRINPKRFKETFGEPVLRHGKLMYIFKNTKTVSHLGIEPQKSSVALADIKDFWNQNSECLIMVTTSSTKLIKSFEVFLKQKLDSVELVGG